MKLTACFVVALAAASMASFIPMKEERVQADENFLNNQHRILDLFSGLGHSDHFKHEHEHFDIMANVERWTNAEVPKKFHAAFKRGFLPKEYVFSLACPHTFYDTLLLFDVFYFAKDFETLYSVACWAKLHVNPGQFMFALRSALFHHPQGRYYHVPPVYEIFPSLFVPQSTMHQAYDEKMAGQLEAHFHFNSTGWGEDYHKNMFGGLSGFDYYPTHQENKISYFREDVALNDAFADFAMADASWMIKDKYNNTFNRAGEVVYFKNQQLLARYALERISLGISDVEPLMWSRPIRAGYNPKISYLNGDSFIARPDNFMPDKSSNVWMIKKSQNFERRIRDGIDLGVLLPHEHGNFKDPVDINHKDGVNTLGLALTGRHRRFFYGSYYWETLNALANLVKTKDDKMFRGGVTNVAPVAMRDPAFFSFLHRFLSIFESHKRTLHPYTRSDIHFPGVSVKKFEADKLVTYIEKFDFEITNGLAVKDPSEYTNLKYYASQYRLNHKPYNFKITIDSEKEVNAMVTIFIGPERDAEFKHLSLEQKRLMFVALDRFPVKLSAGQNTIERSSKEAVFAYSDKPSYRGLYHRLDSAKKGGEQFFKAERTCGFPEHLQLPIGSAAGTKFTFAVIVSPTKENIEQLPKGFNCLSPRMLDDHAMYYPFDRPTYDEMAFNVPNVHFEDLRIFYKMESDINRPEKN